MHPSRLQAIHTAFEQNPECLMVYHNYDSLPYDQPYELFPVIEYQKNKIFLHPDGIHIDHKDGLAIHNAHVSIKAEVQVPRTSAFVRWEDSKYSRDIVGAYPAHHVYIPQPLSNVSYLYYWKKY
jgi:hypothetical protein